MRFPELQARDLDGRSVTLPTDTGDGPTLLLVRFTPRLAGDAETWLPLAADLAEADPDFWCYDLLVLPELPEAVQSSLADELRIAGDAGTGAGVDSRSLTAHTDLSTFQRALVLDGLDRVYALLLSEGRVRWRAFGPLTTPLERSLQAAVGRHATGERADDLVAS
jgi:hypothetical protein